MKISGTEVEKVTNPYSQSVAPLDNEYEDATCSLLIKGEWNDDITVFMQDKKITGLYLNYTKGFKCNSFDFLNDLDNLELLNIIYTPVDSLAQIANLVNLKSLSISCHWKDKIILDGLKKLERCFLIHGKGAESIFFCKSLRYLYIDEFKLKSFKPLVNLEKLEHLTIGNSNFNEPEILGSLGNLRKLVLLNCRKLDNLKGIDKLRNLEWLTIDGSKKVSSIQEIASLSQLKVLQLSNNKEIDTLSYIKNLNKLTALCFFGDTVISDGDFNFLESLKSLSLVGYTGKRHYTHKPARSWNWNDFESNEIAIIRK